VIRVAHPGKWLALGLALLLSAGAVTEFAWPHPALDLQQSRLKLPDGVSEEMAASSRPTSRSLIAGTSVLYVRTSASSITKSICSPGISSDLSR
jgi:hypothetical protein